MSEASVEQIVERMRNRQVIQARQLVLSTVPRHRHPDVLEGNWTKNPVFGALMEVISVVQQHIVDDGGARFERGVVGWHAELEYVDDWTLCFWDPELSDEAGCPQCNEEDE